MDQLPTTNSQLPTSPIRKLGSWALGVGSSASLSSPAAPRDRLEADAAADGRGDDAELRHQPVELRREHRLRAVAECVVGIVVDLDDQAIGAGGNRGARQLRDHVAAAGAMARIRN